VTAFEAKTFYLRSFGCQMNDHDSERIAGVLTEMGMSRCDSPEQAGVLVYNTCSIREKADNRLAGHLGLAARLKRENGGRLVVLAGCLPQSRREDLLSEYPFVDVLVGPQSLHELAGLVRNRTAGGEAVGAFQEATTHWSAELPRARTQGPCAWVQIATGCTNYCSYCIVPYVRGPEASRSAGDVLREVSLLAAGGAREVTFLGQNVNAYGREPDFAGDESFAGLLDKACGVPGVERIRFMTSHPKDVSADLIRLMSLSNQVCEHIHLPVQSGSDGILEAMQRGYDAASYLRLVGDLRGAVPGLSVTTDLIVGFPGETEADFDATVALVEACCFDGAFTFIYSPRRQTEAARLPGRVPAEVSTRRMGRLVEVVQRVGRERNSALVGSFVEVMVERSSRANGREVMGRTRTHKPVNFESTARPGDLVMVELVEATSTSFRGRPAG
jgi:tRNA-2-methylthio-N6-dimethylallyladenosine synthase